MTAQVRVGHTDSQLLAVVRRRARPSELGALVPKLCGVVWDFLRAKGIKGGRHVAVYLNKEMDIEVGAEVTERFTGEGEVALSAIPAGLTASVTHVGPYGTLGKAHSAVQDWCRQNGYVTAGPSWEIYGHWQEEWNHHPERILTDVSYLVQPSDAPRETA